MRTYHILIGNCDALIHDFVEALFREACGGRAAVRFTRTAGSGQFVRQACEADFDLIIHAPNHSSAESLGPTPLGTVGEAIRAIHTIKSTRPAPVIAIVALEERARYESLLLEAGADCVLELPFAGDELRTAIGRLLNLPMRPEHLAPARWFFAGVLMRGFRRLKQA